jgi:hypothetical protein
LNAGVVAIEAEAKAFDPRASLCVDDRVADVGIGEHGVTEQLAISADIVERVGESRRDGEGDGPIGKFAFAIADGGTVGKLNEVGRSQLRVSDDRQF